MNPRLRNPESAKPELIRSRESRSAPRLVPAVQCACLIEHADGTQLIGEVLDVTPAGVRLRLPVKGELPLQRGAAVQLTVRWEGRTQPVSGIVAWIAAPLGGFRELGVDATGTAAPLSVPTLLDLSLVRIDPVWALRVPAQLAVRRQLLPFALVDGEVQVAMANPGDSAGLKAIERLIDHPLKALAAEPESLRMALRKVYGEHITVVATDPDDPVGIVNELLDAARLRQASDIHIDPDRDALRIRLRVDGQLEDYRRLPSAVVPELISRIKILGGLDIAEKRAPQDGRFTHSYGPSEQVDIRVATLPTKHGERASLRLLAMEMEALTLERIGMSPRDLALYHTAIARPHGLLLTTGPTGSGKTTTLYAALRQIIAERPVNAISVQDPVEYDIPGVAQVEVDAAQKVTFAKALRSILRHDPDVIMIGEIRDGETADIAIKAALTGHLVLATLHTNSAASAITRLHDMGVDRFLTAATIRLAMAQRLVRRLCPYCRTPQMLTADQARGAGRPALEGSPCFAARGCVYCAGRGFRGRVGLFGMLPLDETWSREIAQGADETRLEQLIREQRMPTMLDDALGKVRSGVTTIQEALAAVAI